MNSWTVLTLFVPVRVNPEVPHVRHDQQRRVLQRQRVLPQLLKRRVQVLPLRLVLPGEMPSLPNIRPPVAPTVLRRPPLKAILVALRISLHRRPLTQHRA